MAEQLEPQKDIRAKMTATIWGCATGMLAICIPLTAVTKSGPVIPIAVVTGAAVSTVAVWRSNKKSQTFLPSSQLEQIEQRLANLETIAAGNDLDLGLKIKQLEARDRTPQN